MAAKSNSNQLDMFITLDPLTSDPPYEQIRSQITAFVLNGILRPGDRLPSIRQLAGDLSVANGTVARAYRELESDGVVRARGARGTTIVGPPTDATGQQELHDAARAFAARANASGLTFDQAVAHLRVAFATVRVGTTSASG